MIDKNKDMILFLFFGVFTTLVNVFSYWMMAHLMKMDVVPSTILAWILAVFFAYLTNRKWVFRSCAKSNADVIREVISFFGCRFATGMVDWIGMYIFVDVLGWNDVIIKLTVNIAVIILNYVASKLVIFKKQNILASAQLLLEKNNGNQSLPHQGLSVHDDRLDKNNQEVLNEGIFPED